jgi:hypothetical protein
MAKTLDDTIYLAYKRNKSALDKEGVDRTHARALLYVSELFKISPLRVQKIVANRGTKN